MMKRKKTMCKAIIALVVALAFVMPGSAAFATVEQTMNKNISNSEVDVTSDVIPDDSIDPPLLTLDEAKSYVNSDNIEKMLENSDVDWWPMFHHDLGHSGYSSSTAPDTNNVLWEYGTGGSVASSPAVVDGKVFFGSIDKNVYCLDASTGAWIWQYFTGDTVWSSPAVADGKVFIGSGEMASGASNVYCLDASTGLKIWNYTASGGVDSSPTVADGKVFFGSHDKNVYCLNASTGVKIWNYLTGGGVYSSPAVADGKVYFGSKDCNLYCLDASTGAWIWKYFISGAAVMSSPAVVDGKVFFGASNVPLGTVYCLNAVTGAWIWQYNTMGVMVQSSPAVADGKVFVGDFNKKVHCLNALTGAIIWQYTTGGVVVSSPAVADGKVFFGSDDKNVYCLNTDGTLIWKYLTAGTVRSSPAVANGKVFIGSSDNFIYCFGPEPSTTVYVDDDAAPSWYDATHVKTIQEGVNNATAGYNTVYVYNGTYNEKVIVDKRLSLIGESRESVIVNGPGSGNVFYITTPITKVNISNFSITNGQYGIYIYKSSYNKITNCNVYKNTAHGVYIYTTSTYNIITNCNVYNNSYGIYIATTSTYNNIVNCNVYNNKNHGIYIYSSSNNNIKNCNVYNQSNCGLNIYNSPNSNIENSSSHNNLGYDTMYLEWSGYGIQLYNSGSSTIKNCSFTDNWCGIYLFKSPNSVLTDNVINSNVHGFVVDGATISEFYYSIDFSNTINGKPIWYLIMQSGITIDETYNIGYLALVSCTNITVKNVELHNLLLVNTVDSLIANVSSHDGIYGIALYESSKNDFVDCDVHDNYGSSSISASGYGIYLYKTSNNNITNCNVYNNKKHGIYVATTSNYNNITNCNIYNNTGYGINLASSLYNHIKNCNIYDNTNSGVYFSGSSNYNNIINCNIYNNSNYGINLYQSAYCTLTGNAMYDNKVNFLIKGSAGTVTHYLHTIDPTNTVDGKPMYYIVGGGDKTYDGAVLNFGYLAFVSCTNMTAKNADVQGVILVNTIDSTLTNITSHGTSAGIFLAFSYRNNIEGCTLYDNEHGTNIDDSSMYINVRNCVAYNNSAHGIYNRENSHYNIIENCIAYGNKNTGIYVYNSKDVSIINCSSYNNDQFGFQAYFAITDLTIENCTAYGNKKDGFMVSGAGIGPSGENYLTNCTAYDNSQYGFYLKSCTACNLTGNTLYNNAFNFNIDGTAIKYYQHYIDPSNTIDGKPIYYLTGQSNILLDETNNLGYLGLISCTNIIVKNSETQGVTIVDTTHSTILNVTSHHSYYGFSLMNSLYNDFIDCKAYYNNKHGMESKSSPYNNWTNCVSDSNKGGMHFYYSDHCNIINCTNANSGGASEDGIWFQYSWDCNIINCESYNNNDGIYFWSSCDRGNVINNSLHHNSRYGLYISSSSSNKLIYHNIFANNAQNAGDKCSNQWDNGSAGNYWSDYTGVDVDGNGIGDTPYDILGKTPPNVDRYPLMVPVDRRTPIISAVWATPGIQQYPTEPVNVTCKVIDDVMVGLVKVYIDGPGGFTLEAPMNANMSSYWYEAVYPLTGEYEYFIWANDTGGNVAVSDTYSFAITELETPISAVAPLPAWKKIVPFAVTATAYDNTGVVSVTLWSRYSGNGTAWTEWAVYGIDEMAPWSWSFTGSDGYYQFYSIAVDDYGNVEEAPSIADASTGIDTTKPVTTIGLTGTMGGDNWYTSTVTVALSAIDTLSGVESTWYQIDSGYWSLYTALFTVSGDGMHTVRYYSFDRAGNREDTKSETVKIDTKAPVTKHEFAGIIGSQGWYVTNVTVTLSATDAMSGVNHTRYNLNTGGWMVYAGSFVVTENGNYTLQYFSVDLAGNTEATKQTSFRIQHDVVPPVTTHEFNGVMGDNGWFVSDVTVTLSAVDDSAGVAITKYKLDAGAWTTYTGTFLVTEDAAVHTLYYYSVDKVGNREADKSATLKIDRTLPIISLAVEKTGLNKWLLTATVSDETSGVAKVEFYVDSVFVGEDAEAPYELIYSGTGQIAQAIVYDNAGNSAISAEVKEQAAPDSQSQSSRLTLVSVSKDTIQGQSISSTLQRLFNLR